MLTASVCVCDPTLQAARSKVQLLDTQYRMHPSIAAFPSAQFYSGQLRNAPGMADKTARPWHEHAVSSFPLPSEQTATVGLELPSSCKVLRVSKCE